MIRMLTLLLSLALSAASPDAAIVESTGNQQAQPAKPAKPKKVCQKVEMSGSNVPKRICRTVQAPKAETGNTIADSEKPAGNSTN
ncbi:MAG: hypothetical protein A2885_00965 [Sphingopyxis sp. RIFCSPHIGHO2_01_FULL_65_24]|nr:MAG: hypothetical protein A2885_00965 [Sphingopyxis sp. RIFCSPHIGHO2_01_FULL_65_24]